MSITRYNDIRRVPTPEPLVFTQPKDLLGTYCIQDHHARRAGRHHDFRFEKGGVAVSWALRKGMPRKGDHARLAIRTEDHPLDYMQWEGLIPDGCYGAGAVLIVDYGRVEVLEYRADKVKVRLSGGTDLGWEGVYSMMRQGQGPGWLVVHKRHET